jgi:hypothetical protein
MRQHVEQLYRHRDQNAGDTLYVRVLGGAVELEDFYARAHYDGDRENFDFPPGDAGWTVEHIASADLVPVDEVDGTDAAEWVYARYVAGSSRAAS